jgi:nicotinamidase-related amidase
MTAALVLIDLQNSMLSDPDEQPFHPDETLAAARSVLLKAREQGAPVVHVQHRHARLESMQPGHPGFEIDERVAPIDGETVIVKQCSDAFDGTPLAETLRGFGVDRIVVAGMQTELCVDASCRAALGHGFEVTLVADGHTTWDRAGIPAESVIALTNSSLADLAHASREIVPTVASEVEF